MIAAVKGHAAVAALLLDQGTDLTLRNKFNATALQLAAGNGRAEVARLLLAHGANPNEKTGQADEPPIVAAAGSGSIETVQALLDGGASLEAVDRFGSTPLSRAAIGGRSEMVLFLLDQEAAQERPDRGGKRALLSLGSRCISVQAAQALRDRGGYTPAEMQAVLFGLVTGPSSCFELVKWAVASGAEVNGQSDYGNTALILSSMWGHREAASFLLANGADVRLKNREGLTAIDVAGDRAMRKLLKDGK
jgi:ankyrin repeat protein